MWSEETKHGEESILQLQYFDTTKRVIHLAFVNLATIHLKLIDVFNACFNGRLEGDGGWRFLKATAGAIAAELAQEQSTRRLMEVFRTLGPATKSRSAIRTNAHPASGQLPQSRLP